MLPIFFEKSYKILFEICHEMLPGRDPSVEKRCSTVSAQYSNLVSWVSFHWSLVTTYEAASIFLGRLVTSENLLKLKTVMSYQGKQVTTSPRLQVFRKSLQLEILYHLLYGLGLFTNTDIWIRSYSDIFYSSLHA